jgi:hypothetical protein
VTSALAREGLKPQRHPAAGPNAANLPQLPERREIDAGAGPA